jgi:adenosylmethionine-8-amino-7-oxononanoate aminotransferase
MNQKELEQIAKDHLWMHFTEMAQYSDGKNIPIIDRGQGVYLFDIDGNKYLDALSALFCVNVGHGRTEIAEAIKEQAEKLDFVTLWSYAHEGAITLSKRIADLAPGDINRVFFTSGGAESVESAIKLARAYHKKTGNPNKTKFIARELAYHGTTLGALSATGLTGFRAPFEPLTPGGVHVPPTNMYRFEGDPKDLALKIEERILFEGPDTVAAVILEPVQNAGGCLVPPDGYFDQVREICDTYNVLLISDEVICSWGRLGEFFGSARLNYQPDIITTAKGITSAYQPMGAMLSSDKVAEPFMKKGELFGHGFTFAGHPIACAAAHKNIDIFEKENLNQRVKDNEDKFRDALLTLTDIPIVGDVRGLGYFWAIELVKNKDTKETFNQEECDFLIRDFLSEDLYKNGLICRADDRGDPVIQFAPPLIAGENEFNIIKDILRPTLEEATNRLKIS